MEPDALAELSRIIYKTGCSVVISSSWRLAGVQSVVKAMADSLVDAPFGAEVFYRIAGSIVGTTPLLRMTYQPRGDEIYEWLLDNDFVGRIAILDDRDDMDALTPELFLTDERVGLTYEIAERVIAHLNAGF